MRSLFKKNSTVKIFEITLTSMMLALVLIFSYIATFSSIFGFLKIDVSIIFVFITFLVAGYQYAFIILVLKLIIAPSFTGGYNEISMIGHVILFVSFLLFLTTYYVLGTAHNLFFKKNGKYKIKFQLFFDIFYLILTTLITTMILATLNTFIFNGVYFYLFKIIPSASLNSLEQNYQNIMILFFGIENYYLGSYSLYITFNLIQFLIASSIIILFLKFWNKSGNNFKINRQNYF